MFVALVRKAQDEMKAKRLIYNIRTNSLEESEFNFVLSRVEYFELLKWETVYEDDFDRLSQMEFYKELFEDGCDVKILLKLKNGEEVVIDFDRKIHDKLKDYFNG